MRFASSLSSPAQVALRVGAVLLALLTLPGTSAARLAQDALSRVGVTPEPGATVPLDLPVTDAETGLATTLGAVLRGHPAVLLPVDYTCGNVCDPMIGLSADALAATGLPPQDRRIILFGLDPKDDAATARARTASIWGDRPGRPGILVAGTEPVSRLTGALGYRFVYDRDNDSFAHPAAALLVTGNGRLARVLSPLALDGKDLRLALTEAGDGRIGTISDRLALLCYGFDAAKGVYTPLIGRILTMGASLTIAGIAALILLLVRVRSRQEKTIPPAG